MPTQDIENIVEVLSQKQTDIVFKVKKVIEHNDNNFSFEPDEEEIKEMEERFKTQ